MFKKLTIICLLSILVSVYAQDRPLPPSPLIGDKQDKSCKVPEWLVNIPPVMQDDYKTCVNDRFKPSKALVEVVLKQQVNKKAEFIKIETAPRFYTRVYKITYKVGNKKEAMICNDKMTYCLKDKPIVSRKR